MADWPRPALPSWRLQGVQESSFRRPAEGREIVRREKQYDSEIGEA